MGTKIDYVYRDASNYKIWGSIAVSGELSLVQVRPFLFDLQYFIPDEVGLTRLTPRELLSDDHELHEFVEFSKVKLDFCELSAEQLLKNFEAASSKGWF